MRTSRREALETFISIVSKNEGFNEEIEKHKIASSYYMYLTPEIVKEMKHRIKKYHMKHSQSFVIVDNLDNMVKFIKNGIPRYSILISENSGILKTSLGKYDEKKLLDVLLVRVSDVFKFVDNAVNISDDCNIIGIRAFDPIVSELNLNNLDIITASKLILNEIIKLATQIKNKYGEQVCNHQNCWDVVDNNNIIMEINERFVMNNHTETIDKYNLYTRYFDILTYMIETIEYKLKNEIEDPESIPEQYYKNLSQYANGFIYQANEVDKFKLVRSKISIGGNSRIKNLKDYVLSMNVETSEKEETKTKVLDKIEEIAKLAEEIFAEYPEAVDTKKLLTPTTSFVDKSFAEEHIVEEKITEYQKILNDLLDLVNKF